MPLQDDGILRLTVKQLTEHRGYENITNKVLKQHLGPAKVKELQGNPKGHGRAKQEAARVELAEAQAKLAREQDRLARQHLTAGLAGRFRPVMAEGDLAGRWIAEGDVLGHILPPRADVARVLVSQADIALVRDHLTGVQVKLVGHLDTPFPAQMIRAVPQATSDLPAPALGQAGGGPFLTDPTDPEGKRLLQQGFVFDLALPEGLADAPFGARVLVRFDHGTEPAGAQIWRRVRQLFLSRFNA